MQTNFTEMDHLLKSTDVQLIQPGAVLPPREKIIKILGIIKDPRISIDFEAFRSDLTKCADVVHPNGFKKLSGWASADGESAEYSESVDNSFQLNDFNEGYGNLNFSKLRTTKSRMRESPSPMLAADWPSLVAEFFRIYGCAERKNKTAIFAYNSECPFKDYAQTVNEEYLMGELICRKKESVDFYFDERGNSMTGDERAPPDEVYGGLPCPFSLPCCLLQIPAMLILQPVDMCCGKNMEVVGNNERYLNEREKALGSDMQTHAVYDSLEKELEAFAKSFNEKYNHKNELFCSVVREEGKQYTEYTGDYRSGNVNTGQKFYSGKCTVGGDRVVQSDQFALIFYKA